VSYKAIRLFSAKHPEARTPLDRWYRLRKRALWTSFAEVRQTFSAADLVAPYVVFDIAGNRYRLIAEMNFKARVLFIRHIMTHEEYEKGGWKR
jgi:mRNA interferase HigB